MSARLQSRYIQDNTLLATSSYEISAKCLVRSTTLAHPSQMAQEAKCLQTCWLLGSLFIYAKYSGLLNIFLRAFSRSFRRLKILLLCPY